MNPQPDSAGRLPGATLTLAIPSSYTPRTQARLE